MTKFNRNSPCTCGSGKKFKRCCEGRKPVSHTVRMDFGKDTKIDGYKFDENGQFRVLSDGRVVSPVKAWVASSRERKKGDKNLIRAKIDPEEISFGEHAVLKKFSRIFAIDTNTITVDGEATSIACIVESKLTSKAGVLGLQHFILEIFEFKNGPKERYENFAWHILIWLVRMSSEFCKEDEIAIISDSDLGDHDAYNDRQKPYFDLFTLPPKFTLLYAADKGVTAMNKAVGYCDRGSRKLFNDIKEGKHDHSPWMDIEDGWCTRFRGWKNNLSFDKAQKWYRLGELPPYAIQHRSRGLVRSK